MRGNDEVRFCLHCAKSVNDLSAITRKKALKLIRRSRGNICIRFMADPRSQVPIFADDLVQISRRAPRVAAGLMTASLSFAGLGYGQSSTQTVPPSAVEQLSADSSPDDGKNRKAGDDAGITATLKGTIVDPVGAAVVNARVAVVDEDGFEVKTASSNEDGIYAIEGLPAGAFTVSIDFNGFRQFRSRIEITPGAPRNLDAALQPETMVMVAGGIGIAPRQFKSEVIRAVSEGDVEDVRELIARGAGVNEREEDKTTALHIAVENASIEKVRLLLEFGANVNARDEEKRTPLLMIGGGATRELVALLVEGGAKVNVTAEDGTTPLLAAADNSPAEVVQFLIDEGAEIDVRDEDGDTPLMIAAYSDDAESVRALLIAGADVNARNKADETALDQASDKEVIDLLRSFGATGQPKQIDEDPEEPAVGDVSATDDDPSS
jgi:hypothetical protein